MSSKNQFDSTNLVVYLYKWRKPLVVITLMAAILSIIFSSPKFIQPKFKSSVILFPTTTNSISKALLSENPGDSQDILEFGKEEEAEQLIQILNSDEIRNKIILKYDLLNHYYIDLNSPYKNTLLHEEYASNISFRRTQYMSVVIEVFDTDAQMAADIANNIAFLLDSVKNRIQNERAQQGFLIVEREYNKLKKEVRQMEDSLTSLRRIGVHDYENQSAVFNEQYAVALIEGKISVANILEKKMELLSEYGGAYVSIRERLEHMYEELNTLKKKYEEAKLDVEVQMPHKFVVNSAFKAEKKSYPVRSLIVLLATLSSFLFAFFSIIVLDVFKNIR